MFERPSGGFPPFAEAPRGNEGMRAPAPVAIASLTLPGVKSGFNPSTALVILAFHGCPPGRNLVPL